MHPFILDDLNTKTGQAKPTPDKIKNRNKNNKSDLHFN